MHGEVPHLILEKALQLKLCVRRCVHRIPIIPTPIPTPIPSAVKSREKQRNQPKIAKSGPISTIFLENLTRHQARAHSGRKTLNRMQRELFRGKSQFGLDPENPFFFSGTVWQPLEPGLPFFMFVGVVINSE